MMEAATLGPAPFAAHEGMAALIEALSPTDVRFVGGCVRDSLLGAMVADIDLATRHEPDDAATRLKVAGIRSAPTGIAHGTITALLPGGPVEVTTLRRDVSTDGRHATVAFSRDWAQDAARRDFTINALYADPLDGAVLDLFGGLADLAEGRVRFIGDALRRIAEDHLRILRFFRFHARFGAPDGSGADPAGLAACAARANDLMALSRERIAGELLKLLVAPAAAGVVALMVDHGVLRAVLPEIDAGAVERLAALAARETAAAVPPDPIRRLAALLPPDAAAAVGARLRLSNAQRRRLELASGHLGNEGVEALGYRIGVDSALDRVLLHGGDPAALVGWSPPRLPIGGGRLVELGLVRGPAVAAALRAVEDQWIAEGFPDAERTDALARALVADQRRAISQS